MEQHVRRVAWLWVAFGAVVAVGASAATAVMLVIVGDEKTAVELLFVAIGGLVGVVGGLGLLARYAWADVLVLVVGFLHLITFPIGTAIGIYRIWALFEAGITSPRAA